ncbi:electron transfer flavoprotein subunit alpha/FixB family protein [Streptomyces sp. NPDC047000]|uniref:electron transfer flavoprotein subunit alpha/FixB family protein n=1 Tax=Streptomyces sp. NPDC047000 TaxID=3155474 RepID=UPI0033D0C608
MTCAYVFSEDASLAAGLVTAATAVADRVHLVCPGTPPGTPPAGATSVVVLDGPPGTPPGSGVRPEAYAPALARLAGERNPDVVLIGATVSGREIAARVAAALGLALVSEATALRTLPDGGWSGERVTWAGAAVQTETWQGPAVVTMAPGHHVDPAPAPDRDADAVPVETVPAQTDTRVRVVSRAVREREAVDLADAARIVCVGMGAGTLADLGLATDLADALGAELACTRPVAEDREWLAAERYIGISGARVRPDLYIGLGVSGQVQHTAGIRDAKVVVGINTDPDAPLSGASDYAVVGDLREIVPLLTAEIRAARGSRTGPRS